MARLVGAADDEVVVADSTSVNLFKALIAAARLRPSRDTMVIEPGNFPADLYIAESVSELLGLRLVRVEPGSIGAVLDDDVAVVSFSQVDYRTGRAHDMAGITRAVHDVGGLTSGTCRTRPVRCRWTSAAARSTSRSGAPTST